MSTPHPWPLLLAGQNLIFPLSLYPRGLPPCQCALSAAHRANGTNAYWARVREGTGLDASPLLLHRESWGQGSILYSFIHSFTQKISCMHLIQRIRALSRALCFVLYLSISLTLQNNLKDRDSPGFPCQLTSGSSVS